MLIALYKLFFKGFNDFQESLWLFFLMGLGRIPFEDYFPGTLYITIFLLAMIALPFLFFIAFEEQKSAASSIDGKTEKLTTPSQFEREWRVHFPKSQSESD